MKEGWETGIGSTYAAHGAEHIAQAQGSRNKANGKRRTGKGRRGKASKK
jgi:hypothetical protein